MSLPTVVLAKSLCRKSLSRRHQKTKQTTQQRGRRSRLSWSQRDVVGFAHPHDAQKRKWSEISGTCCVLLPTRRREQETHRQTDNGSSPRDLIGIGSFGEEDSNSHTKDSFHRKSQTGNETEGVGSVAFSRYSSRSG